jgi:hypothetical protein
MRCVCRFTQGLINTLCCVIIRCCLSVALSLVKGSPFPSQAKTLAQAGRIGELGDPAMDSIPKDELFQVAEVAFQCVRRAAGQRPKMSQVMALLEQIEKKESRIDMSNVSGSLDDEPPDYGVAQDPLDSYPSQTHLFAELVNGGDIIADRSVENEDTKDSRKPGHDERRRTPADIYRSM